MTTASCSSRLDLLVEATRFAVRAVMLYVGSAVWINYNIILEELWLLKIKWLLKNFVLVFFRRREITFCFDLVVTDQQTRRNSFFHGNNSAKQ